ncbi:YicC/YloC family endoribonuclease [Rubrivirga litoralis]|uniref:YicC/YloC family endoribonuclease n=1 Tax=Rubrivirga litoralis TaxID=3075598 RepID=A0ABU3BQG6_9BACT|nr:YicC/YloC family endoribonuclease [Rubrivirga sp. F394]MDT0631523.1 YicC/YloC family endoribonuclease [Rubrivirga sp. F394]
MIRSMTGFGRGSAAADGAEATVEVRTVNGRYAEATVRGLGDLAEHETAVQSTVKEAIGRGTATVHVSLSRAGGAASGLRVDAETARAAGALLREAAEAAGLGAAAVTLADVLRLPDVLVARPAPDDGAGWRAVQAALAEALGALDAMRRAEGAALRDDLAARADAIEGGAAAVEARAPERTTEARARLHERLDEFVAAGQLEPGRLEAEAVLLADRLDVTEEAVRLRSHLGQFREALALDEPVGRRLNFLAQEIGREVNTVGSKANDAELTRLAVAMKEEVEKIREQVQNVV